MKSTLDIMFNNEYNIKKYIESKLPIEIINELIVHRGVLTGGSLRDIILGVDVKDYDIFRMDENAFYLNYHRTVERPYDFEVLYEHHYLSKVKVNDYHVDIVSDVINVLSNQTKTLDKIGMKYQGVSKFFDYSVNMLMYSFDYDALNEDSDPLNNFHKYSKLYAPSNWTVEGIINDILNKRLIVNEGLLLRANSPERTLKRFDYFLEKGFTIDEENKKKFDELIKILEVRHFSVLLKGSTWNQLDIEKFRDLNNQTKLGMITDIEEFKVKLEKAIKSKPRTLEI